MTGPPPPPPPPPLPEEAQPQGKLERPAAADLSASGAAAAAAAPTLTHMYSHLETMRSHRTELEASLLLASKLIGHPEGIHLTEEQAKRTTMPGGVRDALHAVGDACRPMRGDDADVLGVDAMQTIDAAGTGTATAASGMEITITPGQLGKSTRVVALAAAIDRAATVSREIVRQQREGGDKVTRDALALVQQADSAAAAKGDGGNTASSGNNTAEDADQQVGGSSALILEAFYQRLAEVREYHAKHEASESAVVASLNHTSSAVPAGSAGLAPMDVDSGHDIGDGGVDQESRGRIMQLMTQGQKRRKIRHGNPHVDGYDLHSVVLSEVAKVRGGEMFSPEEAFGKYLDLVDAQGGLSGTLRDELAKAAAAASNSTGTGANSRREADPPSEGSEEKKDDLAPPTAASFPYVDFLSLLTKPLATFLPEPTKLNHRKQYVRFLSALYDNLFKYLYRTMPLLNVEKEVIGPALDDFERTWRESGGFDGWEKREAEKILAAAAGQKTEQSDGKSVGEDAPKSEAVEGIDLALYSTPQALCGAVNADTLKAELSRIGLKCGGAPLDRAKRLFLTKDTAFADLPRKIWAKGRGPPSSAAPKSGSTGGPADGNGNDDMKSESQKLSSSAPLTSAFLAGSSRRIDVARLEAATQSLIDQLRPTLDDTVRRAERRLYQTPNEREVELDEEINGVAGVKAKTKDEKKDKSEGEDSDEDSDEEDAPIYNPKGVPLGWDGKPIPYWLFKLHGLNHFYSCEICGNESYRGRHNFEKHFQEPKHLYGMRCLGIPNTRHFHGVTKIEDAQRLWDKLQQTVEGNVFDGEKEEEYEDSHGNVLTRKTFEDLARQGLL